MKLGDEPPFAAHRVNDREAQKSEVRWCKSFDETIRLVLTLHHALLNSFLTRSFQRPNDVGVETLMFEAIAAAAVIISLIKNSIDLFHLILATIREQKKARKSSKERDE